MAVHFHIAAIPTRPRGWVSVSAEGQTWPAGPARLRVVHWGHRKPFLGAQGWQVAEIWCELESALGEDGRSSLLLPPSLTRWFDTGSNYQLTLVVAGNEVLKQAISWRIGSGRMTAAEASPTVGQINAVLAAAASPSSTPGSAAVSDNGVEAAWTRARQVDSPAAYEPFSNGAGPYAEQARHALAHFLPPRVSVRFAYAQDSTVNRHLSMNLCAFLLDAAERTRADHDFVSAFAVESATQVRMDRSACGGVIHRGARPGQQGYIVEAVDVDFALLPADVCSLALTVSLFTDAEHATLQALEAGELQVIDIVSGQALLGLDIPRRPGVAGAFTAQLLRRDGAWKLMERSDTFASGLAAICARFGVDIAEGAQ